ncbi:MAG: glycosyltransferase family 1 protein, partial [Waterburya sp.]
ESGIVCEEQTPIVIANALRQVLEHPDNYPAQACTQVARPYNARNVVNGIYSQFLQEWKQTNVSRQKHEPSKMQKI